MSGHYRETAAYYYIIVFASFLSGVVHDHAHTIIHIAVSCMGITILKPQTVVVDIKIIWQNNIIYYMAGSDMAEGRHNRNVK